jgi:hypothetical protein
MNKQAFPSGWDKARVQRLIEHYEAMSDDEIIGEDDAAHEAGSDQLPIPSELTKTNGRQRQNQGKQRKSPPRGKRKAKRSQ